MTPKNSMAFDVERARLGGEGKELQRQERLWAFMDQLPELHDEADGKRRLELLSDAAARGLLAGSQAGAAIRAVEVWLKLREHELDRARFVELERKLTALESELARERGGRK